MTKTKTLLAQIYVVGSFAAGLFSFFVTALLVFVKITRNNPKDEWSWPMIFATATLVIFYSTYVIYRKSALPQKSAG